MAKTETRMQRLGRRVKNGRLDRQWTQKDLAARTGIAQTTISALENGKGQRPRMHTLNQIAFALDLDADELLVDSGWPDVAAYLKELKATQAALGGLSEKDAEVLRVVKPLPEEDKDWLIDLAKFLRTQRGSLVLASV